MGYFMGMSKKTEYNLAGVKDMQFQLLQEETSFFSMEFIQQIISPSECYAKAKHKQDRRQRRRSAA